MKVNSNRQTLPAFIPVELNITLENQDELDAWHSLFNHGNIITFMRECGVDTKALFYALHSQGGRNHRNLLSDYVGVK